MEPKIGQRFRILNDPYAYKAVGKVGRYLGVISTNGNLGFEFEERVYHHGCNGHGRKGYCAWVNRQYISPIEDLATLSKRIEEIL